MKSVTNIKEAIDVRNSEVADLIKRQMEKDALFLTVNEVKYVYGSKGGLRLVLTQDRQKLSSKYKRVCEKIANKYRVLKIETALANIEEGLKTLLYVPKTPLAIVFINSLYAAVNDFKAKISSLKESNEAFRKIHDKLLVNKQNMDKYFDEVIADLNKIKIYFKQFSPTSLLNATKLTVPVFKTSFLRLKAAIDYSFNQKEMKEFLESSGGKELRQVIGKFLNLLSDCADQINNSLAGFAVLNYNAEQYKEFVDSCGALAQSYLKSEASSKLKRIQKGAKSCDVDKGKLIFMSLICICSTNQKHKEYGYDIYKKTIKLCTVTKTEEDASEGEW